MIDSSLLHNAFIVGDAKENSTLEMAGIMRAKVLFMLMGGDHWNLILSFSARQLTLKLTIVSECVYLKNREKIIQAGVNGR